jgi:hypothetical protein
VADPIEALKSCQDPSRPPATLFVIRTDGLEDVVSNADLRRLADFLGRVWMGEQPSHGLPEGVQVLRFDQASSSPVLELVLDGLRPVASAAVGAESSTLKTMACAGPGAMA